MKSDISKHEKVDKLLKYGEKIEFYMTGFSQMTIQVKIHSSGTTPFVIDNNMEVLHKNVFEQCNEKLPVEIFEQLFMK